MYILIDNKYKADLTIGYFGTWSERIRIIFEDTHPIFDKYFMTKYYNITDNIIYWGHENKKMYYKRLPAAEAAGPNKSDKAML